MRHGNALQTAATTPRRNPCRRVPARVGDRQATPHPGAAARILDGVAVLLAVGFLLLAARSLWLGGKAMLADRLIAAAFAAHVRDGGTHRPWGWADVHPVGLLEVPRLGERVHVLGGASGSSLAFGLGHVDGTAAPNGRGNCVLAGHRDTRFAFLKELRVGDGVTLTTRDGARAWTVESLGVVDDDRVDLLAAASPAPRLTLMTCWPFDGLTPGSRRYVVWCRPAAASAAAARVPDAAISGGARQSVSARPGADRGLPVP